MGNVMPEEDFEMVGNLVQQAEATLIDEYEPLKFLWNYDGYGVSVFF